MNRIILKYFMILFVLIQLSPVMAAGNGQGTNNDLSIDIPTSDSFARNLKLQAIEDLDSINLTGKSNSFLVSFEKIRSNLEMSLTDGEFQGPDHIANGTLFHDDRKAIENLLNLLKMEDDVETRKHLESALTHLIQSDRRITQISLEELQLISTFVEEPEIKEVVEKNLTFSQKKFDEAVSDIETYRFNSVITKLHLSWNHSNGALLVAGKYVDPIIVIDSPINNSYTNNPDTMISGIVIKAMVYTIEYVDIFHNGAYTTTPLDYGVFGKAIVLSEGMNEFTVNATDIYGNTGTSTVFVVLDTIPPEISVSGVENNRYYQTNVTALITITDENIAATRITLDGIDYISGTEISYEMAHVLEVYASDLAGNTASKKVVFTIDRTPPDVSIDGPLNNDFIREIINIHGIAADANLDLVNLLIDGRSVSSSIPFLWNTQLYNDGIHSILLKALDKAGNKNQDEVQVTIDNTPPVISIESPSDNYYTNHDVGIAGSVTDTNLESFYVKLDDEILGDSLPLLWEIQDYPDKVYTINTGARDKAGNTATTTVTVTLDTVPPELNVTEQPYYPVLSIPDFTVWGSTEPGTAVTINGNALDNNNGNFTGKVTMVKGINTVEVVSTDLAGNFNSWNKTIMLDEDDLPDWYEIEVLGTDPLDGDSNSSKTLPDESDNNINDDYEDFDNDGLRNREEFAYGLDPFNPDNDEDGLTDWYELRITGTDPLVNDTDGNGVEDSDEDPDSDLLSNLAEQGYNTNPYSNDSDEDGLTDHREIFELGTDPIKNDTDDDFLDDAVELKPFFNTDPLNPDTNGNGILDGHELYKQIFGNETLGVEITIYASDDREGTFIFEPVEDDSKFETDALIGEPVNLLSTKKFSNVTLKMFYDEALLGSTNESDLAIFYFDEVNHSFVAHENQGVNTAENFIWAITDHFSSNLMMDQNYLTKLFYSAYDPTTPLLSRGKLTRIKANVHNLNESDAKKVTVAFYNGDPDYGGYLIGYNETSEIKGLQSKIVSIDWWVPLNETLKVLIKVDPFNTIEENNESNNVAYRLLDEKSIDSDGDGLTDFDELNGMRTSMGTVFFTDPGNPDTDGDGLDDGKEMGQVVEVKNGIFESEPYYFLFSYPSTNVTGRVVSDPSDSDNDGLSDLVEYNFGSSGIDQDTDGDLLKDLDEKNIGTLPRDIDTDRDGLTDWWETVTNQSINPYGSTDPLNRDSDNDGAIDGGESNVYSHTPIDIDNDGVIDSGKQIDLNGDGYIEMGEENFYETPPNEITYFLDIFAVADNDFRKYYWLPWDPFDKDNYKEAIYSGVDEASVYFMDEFGIKLKVVEISDDVWNSDDAKNSYDLFILLDDVMNEFNWKKNKKGMDTLIAFTGKDPYVEGGTDVFNKTIVVQIPEICDPEIYPYVGVLKILGIWPSSIPDYKIEDRIQSHWDSYLIQHEVSHIFEAYDYGLQYDHKEDPISNKTLARINGVMDKTLPYEDWVGFYHDPLGNIWFSHEWNPESVQIINSTKMIKTNGPYIKKV